MAHSFLRFSIFPEDCVSLHSHQAGHKGPLFCTFLPAVGIIIKKKKIFAKLIGKKMASQFNLHFFDYKRG